MCRPTYIKYDYTEPKGCFPLKGGCNDAFYLRWSNSILTHSFENNQDYKESRK